MSLSADGFEIFPAAPATARWAEAASAAATRIAADPAARARHLRHGGTWFVGVDALPTGTDGSIDGVPLAGSWRDRVPDLPLHRAQLSIVYPGYPRRDPDETEAAHRFRVVRCAAHVDGIHAVGPGRRRVPVERHGYILGLPLDRQRAAATVVWRGSHRIIAAALERAIGGRDPGETDVTDAYNAARRAVFETCERVEMGPAEPGAAFLIHRFAVHGTAPWPQDPAARPDAAGRMVAFFRPEMADPVAWLTAP